MDSTNLTEYCEYNARKAWAKRLGIVPRLYAPAEPMPKPAPGIVVTEHDASPSMRARIRAAFWDAP